MTDESDSICVELLKLMLKPGYIYFKCTDGNVYSAEIQTPEPNSTFYIPKLQPAEESE